MLPVEKCQFTSNFADIGKDIKIEWLFSKLSGDSVGWKNKAFVVLLLFMITCG